MLFVGRPRIYSVGPPQLQIESPQLIQQGTYSRICALLRYRRFPLGQEEAAMGQVSKEGMVVELLKDGDDHTGAQRNRTFSLSREALSDAMARKGRMKSNTVAWGNGADCAPAPLWTVPEA